MSSPSNPTYTDSRVDAAASLDHDSGRLGELQHKLLSSNSHSFTVLVLFFFTSGFGVGA